MIGGSALGLGDGAENIERMLVEADVSGKDFAGRGGRAFEVETSRGSGGGAAPVLSWAGLGRQTGWSRTGGESTRMRQITSGVSHCGVTTLVQKPEGESLEEADTGQGWGLGGRFRNEVAPLGQRRRRVWYAESELKVETSMPPGEGD